MRKESLLILVFLFPGYSYSNVKARYRKTDGRLDKPNYDPYIKRDTQFNRSRSKSHERERFNSRRDVSNNYDQTKASQSRLDSSGKSRFGVTAPQTMRPNIPQTTVSSDMSAANCVNAAKSQLQQQQQQQQHQAQQIQQQIQQQQQQAYSQYFFSVPPPPPPTTATNQSGTVNPPLPSQPPPPLPPTPHCVPYPYYAHYMSNYSYPGYVPQ